MRELGAGAHPDEQALWARLLTGEKPRYAGSALGIPPRRIRYLCEKWARRGLYDWRVVVDLGWPTR